MYAGGMDALGKPYVARVYWSHKLGVSLQSVFIELLLTIWSRWLLPMFSLVIWCLDKVSQVVSISHSIQNRTESSDM